MGCGQKVPDSPIPQALVQMIQMEQMKGLDRFGNPLNHIWFLFQINSTKVNLAGQMKVLERTSTDPVFSIKESKECPLMLQITTVRCKETWTKLPISEWTEPNPNPFVINGLSYSCVDKTPSAANILNSLKHLNLGPYDLI